MKNVFAMIAMTLLTSPAFAIHMYAGYTCTSEKLELRYDGPGSNYAVGGFANFYTRASSEDKVVKALAWELMGEEDSGVGEEISEQTVQVVFETVSDQQVGPIIIDDMAQDCFPGEYNFEHSDWNSRRVVKITDISAEAAANLGLRKGAQITFTCKNTTDEPYRCPGTPSDD